MDRYQPPQPWQQPKPYQPRTPLTREQIEDRLVAAFRREIDAYDREWWR